VELKRIQGVFHLRNGLGNFKATSGELENWVKQLGIADGISAGFGFHGSKRKFDLVSKPALRAGGRENLADGDGEFLEDLSDHFDGHPKTAGRTFTGGSRKKFEHGPAGAGRVACRRQPDGQDERERTRQI
jgi:hypothetical protein